MVQTNGDWIPVSALTVTMWDILHGNTFCLSSWFWAAGAWLRIGVTGQEAGLSFDRKQWQGDRDKIFCHFYRFCFAAFLGRNKYNTKRKHQKLVPSAFPGFRTFDSSKDWGFCLSALSQNVSWSSCSREGCSSLGYATLPAGWSIFLRSVQCVCSISLLACTIRPELKCWLLETTYW